MGRSDTLTNVQPIKAGDVHLQISQADGRPLPVSVTGRHPILPGIAGQVIVSPNIPIDLYSWGALERSGLVYSRDPVDRSLRHWTNDQGQVILTARLDDATNLYVVDDATSAVSTSYTAARATKLWSSTVRPPVADLVLLLHLGLGHISQEGLIKVVKKKLIANLPVELTERVIRKHFPDCCLACVRGQAITIAPVHSHQRTPARGGEGVREDGQQVQQAVTAAVAPLKQGEPLSQLAAAAAVSVPEETLAMDLSDYAGNDPANLGHDGSRYMLLVRSLLTLFVHVVFLKTKDQLPEAVARVLEEYALRGGNVTSAKLDNEYDSAPVRKVLAEHGCRPQFCPPHEHFANGFAEQCVQLVDRGTRTVMHGASPLYPRNRWTAAASFKVLCLNYTTESKPGSGKSAWEAFMGTKPDFSIQPCLPFGRETEGLLERSNLAKQDSRTFAGFSEGPAPFHMHAVKLLDPATGKTVTRRSFWMRTQSKGEAIVDLSPDGVVTETQQAELASIVATRKARKKDRQQARQKLKATAPPTAASSQKNQAGSYLPYGFHHYYPPGSKIPKQAPKLPAAPAQVVPIPAPAAAMKVVPIPALAPKKRQIKHYIAPAPPRTSRRRALPNLTRDEEFELLREAERANRKAPQYRNPQALFAGNGYLGPKAMSATSLAFPGEEFTLPQDDIDAFHLADPRGYKRMLKHPAARHFLAAADEEIANLAEKAEVWNEVEGGVKSLPIGAKIYNSMFIWKTKRDNRGALIKYKARLTICGNEAEEVGDTYAPCVHAETVRLFMALAAAKDLDISALDISAAFVQEDLPVGMKIYMRLPRDHYRGEERIVELTKSLYGLCEAPRIFHTGLVNHLLSLGYVASSFDPCLFHKTRKDGTKTYALVHVDDILVLSPRAKAGETSGNEKFRADMERKYDITWQPEATDYLGYLIKRNRQAHTLTISQPAYARHVVQQAALSHNSVAPSPGDHIAFTGTSKGKGDPARLRKIVGLLQFLTNTRIDILTELNRVAKTMNDPTFEDVQAAERIVRYINSTLDYGITFSGTSTQLFAWADASFESERGGFSRSSIVFSIGENSGAFLAKSFTQHIRAMSTQETEIQALSEAARYVIFFRMILNELGFPQLRNVIFEDNNAAISFAKGESDFERTKHIARHYRYAAQQYDLGNIDVVRIDTTQQRADQGTKILPPYAHKAHTAVNLNLAHAVA